MGTWTLSDVPPELRALAEDAAARSGLSLGDWLAQAIRAREVRRAAALAVPEAAPAAAGIESEPDPAVEEAPVDTLRVPATVFDRFLPPEGVVARVVPVDSLRLGPIQTGIELLIGADVIIDVTAADNDIVLVRPDPCVGSEYEIVAGHAAWKSARRSRAAELTAMVADLSDDDVLKLSLIGVLRADAAPPVAAAEARTWLRDRGGLAEDELSVATGGNGGSIPDDAALLTLPPPVLERVDDGSLPVEIATSLAEARCPEPVSRIAAAHKLSTDQTRSVARLTNRLDSTADDSGEDIVAALSSILDAKVAVARGLDDSTIILRIRRPKRKAVVYRLRPETPKEMV